jgi:hypothetical protein
MEITEQELKDKIDAAIEEAVQGLKAKNTELLGKVHTLQKGQQVDPQTVIDLEKKIDLLQTDLTEKQKTIKDSAKVFDTMQKNLKIETDFTQKLLIDNGLTDALVKANVSPLLLKAAKAMFASQAQVVIDGENRIAKIGDKQITDFITEWTASEEGKHFVLAPANSGGGAQGGGSKGSDEKILKRTDFDAKSPSEKMQFIKSGGKITD